MNLDFLTLIVAGLATFRLSLLFTKEKGPGKFAKKLRNATPPRSSWREWITCIFCFSMTASAIVCGLLYWGGVTLKLPMWFLLWCALSSITIAINQKFTKGPL